MSETESFFASATDRSDYIKNAVPVYAPVIDWALSATTIPQPKNVVDIGCGLGHSTQLLKKHFGESKIVGLDVCPHAISEGVVTDDSVEFHVGNIGSLLGSEKLQGESFDFAFASFFSSDFEGDEEYQYFEPLVDDLLAIMPEGGVGLFVHTGPECEDFLTGIAFDEETAGDRVLRPKRAEWKMFDSTEYCFVEFHVIPNNFYT